MLEYEGFRITENLARIPTAVLGEAGDGGPVHSSHLVLRTIGCPIGIVRRNHVGLRPGMMKDRVNDIRRDALGDERAERSLASATC
jgi:hypothetical protein